MIHEPQEAPQITLARQPGIDSMADRRSNVRVQYWTDALQLCRLKSLADLIQVLHSRVCEDEPQAAVMPGSAQKPVGLQTQKHWGKSHITPRYHHALGVILRNRAGVTGASRNGGQDTSVTMTRPEKSQAFR